ncbi:hypothetical protein CHARACLAT_031308 [Characodon lateralis]|uniref:Uncharacterized protein n=1 Tax=Characodon lateralis TaxID=208331 RepID=A0ABU7EYU8_9TELE|nr:hypothetical protein [Characodon lateralis]
MSSAPTTFAQLTYCNTPISLSLCVTFCVSAGMKQHQIQFKHYQLQNITHKQHLHIRYKRLKINNFTGKNTRGWKGSKIYYQHQTLENKHQVFKPQNKYENALIKKYVNYS